MDAQPNVFDLALHILPPRSPQTDVGQQARFSTQKIVRGNPQLVYPHVNAMPRQVGQLDPLAVGRQIDQMDFVVFYFAIERQTGRCQRSVAVDPHPSERRRRHGVRCQRRRHWHRVHAGAIPAADELFRRVPYFVSVEVDPAIDVGLPDASGRHRDLERDIVDLAPHQRRNDHPVFVIDHVQVIPQRLRMWLPVRLRIRPVGRIA